MPRPKHRYIYGLIDPRTGLIRYIGKCTRSPEERLGKHMHEARTSTSQCHRLEWLRQLDWLDLMPLVTVLDELPSSARLPEHNEAERWWIATARDYGYDLTNNTDGGDGGSTWDDISEEERARRRANMSVAARKRLANMTPEERANMGKGWRGKKQPAEMVAARIAMIDYEEVHRKVRETVAANRKAGRKVTNQGGTSWIKGLTHTPETRAKISAKLQGHKRSAESIAKSTESNRKTNAARIAAGLPHPNIGRPAWNKGIPNRPEARAKLAAAHAARRPDTQRGMSEMVAKQAGVHPATVIRAIRDSPNVRPWRRDQVYRAIDELGLEVTNGRLSRPAVEPALRPDQEERRAV